MKKKILVFLLVVFFVFVSTNVSALKVPVTMDTFVSSARPDKIYAQSHVYREYLWSGGQLGGDVYFSFLQFDLGEGILSSNSELNIFCNDIIGGYNTTTKVWYLEEDGWSDDTLTYNTMPDFWTSPDLLDEQCIDSYGWHSWDVGAVSDSDGTISFVVGSLLPHETMSGTYLRAFENSEYDGGNNPYITNVTSQGTPVPEPATMFLFGSGLIGMVGAIRRKKK